MRHIVIGVCIVMVICVARETLGQEGLTEAARLSLGQLRLRAGPELSTVIADGRVSWASSIDVAAASDAPETAATAFLRSYGDTFGVATELEVVDVVEHLGTSYVHLRPRYLGVPVLGAEVVVALGDGAVRRVASGLRPWLGPRALPTTISATEAAHSVEVTSGRAAVVPEASALGWLPLAGDPGHLLLVWIVEQRELAPFRDWRYVVEATTGAVLWRHDQVQRAEGYIYDTNPETAGGEVSRVELPPLNDDVDVLEGPLARSFRCVASTGDCSWAGRDCRLCGEREHTAVMQEDGNFLYEPDEPNLADPFSEVQAYYHASIINEFFDDVLGFERTCGGSRAITIYVNQSYPGDEEASANAGYGDGDGDGCGDLIMGEGLGIDFTYDAEVIYHEFTHGIVEAAGGLGCAPFGVCYDSLGLNWVPGGLNEGFADYFSVSFVGDPNLGEHSALAFPGDPYVRTVDHDYMCPFDLIGESHYDGMILGGLGWDLRELLGADVADRMMLSALVAIHANAGYAEVAAALSDAAQAELDAGAITNDEVEAIERIMGPEGRGVTDCRRIVPLDAIPEGHHEDYQTIYTFQGMSLPGGLQWSLTTPRHAESLRFWIDDYGDSAGLVVAHVRRGDPVEVDMSFNATTYQLDLDFTDDFTFDVTRNIMTLDVESDPVIDDDTTYYIALEFQCPDGCLIRARGEVEGEGNEPPTASAGEDQEVEQGATVSLDGSASTDPDGDELTFAWAQIDGPTLELTGADSATASFVAEELGTYELQLTVTDSGGAVGQDSVVVTVTPASEEDAGPTADGGADAGDAGDAGEVPVMSATGGTCDCLATGRAPSSDLRRLLGILGL